MPRPKPSDFDGVRLIQFAKWPEPGRVKTRLAADLGERGALDAHIRLTGAVLDNLLSTGLPVSFWWDRARPDDPGHATSILDRLQAADVAQRIQAGKDLGARMSGALDAELKQAGAAVIVGSDCPSVDAAYIAEAIRALADDDVVLGPSDDGGFVLIGARRPLGPVLNGIAWGTDKALEQTRDALVEAGCRVHCLPARWDVDTLADWQRFLDSRRP
ncbi:TIGR04282 family arsenosugar biosynthesis glycosyltransferase [Marinobacter bohaiensis]|uniref:TIGR04282 family arsenosugar biosynthesis glycosyltransferase n=1 Tax=Marinobacter bohaiensis TaxID=2201898 RepID=UPI000DAEC2D8|nr:TIGR04282 family arsenosugar biosynthesis glycosyltransferase [Marinobacter bohaiensis]